MNRELSEKLSKLLARDQTTRAALVESGELFDGYHPRMAAVHADNAAELSNIVDEWGWPGRSLVGENGANAAWLILQHSIGHPKLLRRCLPLLQDAAASDAIPLHQPAFLEDRICTFEGRPQRYGTQFDWDENGELSPLPLLDPDTVDRDRASVGLGTLSERIEEVRAEAAREGARPPSDSEARKREMMAWAKSVGWR